MALVGLLFLPAVASAGPKAPVQYQLPPSPIPQILDTAPPPRVLVSSDRKQLALLGRENLPSIAELAEPELHLAGYRMNPRTNGPAPSRVAYLNSITVQDIATGAERPVKLGKGLRLMDPTWSPDGTKIAFINVTRAGMELWVADAATGNARALTGPTLTDPFSARAFVWMPDSRSLLTAQVLPKRGAPPPSTPVPAGPVIEENEGKATPAPTFGDLLKTPADEALFDYYFTSRLVRVPVTGGAGTPVGEPGVITSFDPSPDGRFLLVERVKRPYSYRVRADRFPKEIDVLDPQGKQVKRIADLPLAEEIPINYDAVRAGPREVEWRADAPATLAWAEALDGGDPRVAAKLRDRVLLLEAPFTGEPRKLIDLEHRVAQVAWGRDDFALVVSGWWNTRWEKRFAVDPSKPEAAPRVLADRSYEDRYNAPGSPVLVRNAAGHMVLQMTEDGRGIYLRDEGASPKGNYPFLDRMDVTTGKSERLWRAADPYYETAVAVLDANATRVLTRRESKDEPPNFFVRTLQGGEAKQLTRFPDPAPQLAGIQRQLITYPRADGVTLSATLILPPGYEPKRDGPLPLLMWAYPREFKDAAAASQVDDSPNRFSRPAGASHLFVLTQGYAVLDGPAMPIVGPKGIEPNDTYVEQLVASAKAAVDKVVELGVADRNRIAVGGHSYGAFMTANLLAHTDFFRAGIARSGAYNRTLTPFSFQAEQRNYWQARDTYTRMSPFTYADKIKTPILLIHGAADDNSGTFPVQSERFYAALKGNGATVRYVSLPYEAHGYRARESVLHTLFEMVSWLDKHVKNAPAGPASTVGKAAP
jgi:dipeptidyl aminopeptidase/acylaminoacyl peptidase